MKWLPHKVTFFSFFPQVRLFWLSKDCESKTVIYRRQSPPFPLAEKETGNKAHNQSAQVSLPGDSGDDHSKSKTEGNTHPKGHRYEEIKIDLLARSHHSD
jgi:hypothetical protein